LSRASRFSPGLLSNEFFLFSKSARERAIAIALAKEMKNIFLVATDISKDALAIAMENAKSEGVPKSD